MLEGESFLGSYSTRDVQQHGCHLVNCDKCAQPRALRIRTGDVNVNAKHILLLRTVYSYICHALLIDSYQDMRKHKQLIRVEIGSRS